MAHTDYSQLPGVLRDYGLALLATAAALLLRRLLDPVLGDSGLFFLLYAAIALISVYLGTGPSLLTALVGLLGSYWLVLKPNSLSIVSPPELAHIIGYLLVSAIMILLAHRARKTLLMVEVAHDNLENKVEERTRELNEALQKLHTQIQDRRKLSARLLRVQDEEHRRIARELHDSMGQTLAALRMTTGSLQNMVPATAPISELFHEMKSQIDQAIQETRTISHLLHPPLLDELGFASAARWYVNGFAQRSGIHIRLDISTERRLTESIDLALFRILQESLTNILRHSGSRTADVCFQIIERQAILCIKDYGKGIASDRLERFRKAGANVGVGLSGMLERVSDLGGKLELQNHGTGTVVRVILPLTDGATPKAPDVV